MEEYLWIYVYLSDKINRETRVELRGEGVLAKVVPKLVFIIRSSMLSNCSGNGQAGGNAGERAIV